MIEDLQSRIQEQSEKSAKSESTQTMSEPDRKPFGYWRDIDNVVRELQAEMQRRGLTTVPTYGYLVSIGRSDLQAGMAKYHKIGDIRKLVGDQSPGMKEAGYWKDKKNILAHAKALQAQGFDFQNLNKLRDGNSVLRYAIQHYPGGQDNFFIDMGITYNPSNRVKWKTQEELVATLQTYKKENGLQRLPHARILAEKIDRKIEHAINKFGGMTTLRKLVGDTPKFDGHTYNTPESLKAFAQYILQKHGRTTLPTQSELKDLGYSGFIFAVTSNGGLNKLRKSLGETSCHGDKDWTNEEFIINQAREIMAAQNVTKLPAPQRLRELGYSAFSAAIDKYHGGYVCFR
ncbi:MAG TPA: hypothetical protein VK158_00655, partial [Acidobacteriota bacterium]|nr:hypothetical protein [Acidobacteriota bacterium]